MILGSCQRWIQSHATKPSNQDFGEGHRSLQSLLTLTVRKNKLIMAEEGSNHSGLVALYLDAVQLKAESLSSETR